MRLLKPRGVAAAPALNEGVLRDPVATPRFDLAMALLAALVAGGLVLDVWAHAYGQATDASLTPWDALLYGAIALSGVVLALAARANRARGRTLPAGYGLALFGVALVATGAVLDLLWQVVIGGLVGAEQLVSPTRLLMGLGVFLLVGGSLQAALRAGIALARPWAGRRCCPRQPCSPR